MRPLWRATILTAALGLAVAAAVISRVPSARAPEGPPAATDEEADELPWRWKSDRDAPVNPPRTEFDRAEARARAAGFATTWDEWVADGDPPGYLDLFQVWLAVAFPKLSIGDDLGLPAEWDDPLDDVWSRAKSEAEIEVLRAALPPLRDVAAAVREVAAKPRLSWGRKCDLNECVGMLIAASRVMEAWAVAAPGDEERAALIADCLRFSCAFEPRTWVEAHGGHRLARGALRALRLRLESGEADCERLRDALEPHLRSLRAPTAGWWCWAEIVHFCAISRGRDDPAGLVGVARLIDAFVRIGSVADSGTFLEWWRAADPLVEPSLRVWTTLGNTASPPRFDAVVRLARIALAVGERKRASGTWPASLAEIAADFPDGVPTDPFTDAPFSYEVTTEGVRISSAGHLPGEPPPSDETRRERGLVWVLR